MRIKISLLVGLAVTCFAMTAAAQVKAPKFTSIYTNLKTACKSFKGSNGSDGYSICKGPAGYQVRVYYSASATHVNAEQEGKDGNFPITTASLNFDWDKAKIEWRLADGKPFAAIMRAPKYSDPADGEFFGKVVGQQLVVTGLLGFESLSTKIDAKTKGANALAREAADSEYLAKK